MSISPSRTGAGALLATCALLLATVPALAADAPTTTSTTTTSTSTTTSSTTSTTSTTLPGGGGSSTSSTTTSTTAPATKGSSTTTTSTSSTTTSTTTPLPPPAVPPEVQAMIDAYPRTAAGSTRELVEALGSLPAHAARAGFGRFPVAGPATWSHDWLFPRHEPEFHVHEGTDVFAARGTPVLAPAIGTVRISNGSIGGLAVNVVQDDGTYWYLAHLDTVTVADGDPVGPGDVVGTVGDSGNASGGAPHVHLEVHPFGGEPHDPKHLLDAYYAEALAAAPAVVQRYAEHAGWGPDRLEPLPTWCPVREPIQIETSTD